MELNVFQEMVQSRMQGTIKYAEDFNAAIEDKRVTIGMAEMERRHVWRLNKEDNKDQRPVWWGEEWHQPTKALETVVPMTEGGFSICHTPNKKRSIDRPRTVVTKPGRFLRKYYGDALSDAEIEYWAQAHKLKTQGVLMFATTQDEIARVYKDGPHSCMRKLKFPLGDTPVKAYAAGDLAVAYIQKGDAIEARVICWPDKKVYLPKVYGQKSMLVCALREAGYREGTITGARLLKLQPHIQSKILKRVNATEVNDQPEKWYSLPYLDNSVYTIIDDGSYFRISDETRSTGDNPVLRSESGCIKAFKCQICGFLSRNVNRWGHCVPCQKKPAKPCIFCLSPVASVNVAVAYVSTKELACLTTGRRSVLAYTCENCVTGVPACSRCGVITIGATFRGQCQLCYRAQNGGPLDSGKIDPSHIKMCMPYNTKRITIMFNSELPNDYQVFAHSKFGSEPVDHVWTYLRPEKKKLASPSDVRLREGHAVVPSALSGGFSTLATTWMSNRTYTDITHILRGGPAGE